MKRKPIFYNVLTGSLSLLGKEDTYFTDPETPNFKKSPRWYTNESDPSFYYPYILVSGPNNRKKDVRNDIKVGKDTTVFGDSGGFQLAMKTISEKEWDREKALKWSEDNADLFPILDLPAAGKTKHVQDAIEYTVKSARYYADNRTRSDRTIMNVLSSPSYAGMQKWYDSVKEFKFDGWAFGGHSNHLKTIISAIIFLVRNGEFDTDKPRPLHVFGTTSMGVIPYITYAQHLLNQEGINIQLSFDSSSASAMVNYGNYIRFCTPNAMVNTGINNSYDWSKLDGDSNIGCSCPMCRDIDDMPYLLSPEGKGHFYTIIALHNFYQMYQYKRTFEGIFSLNCEDVLESLPMDIKRNFTVMRNAFAKKGLGGIDVIQNDIKTRSKKNPLDKAATAKSILQDL